MNRDAHPNDVDQFIDVHRVYSRAAFMRTLGLGKAAWLRLKREGLPTATIAGRCFVRGSDFDAWIANRAKRLGD